MLTHIPNSLLEIQIPDGFCIPEDFQGIKTMEEFNNAQNDSLTWKKAKALINSLQSEITKGNADYGVFEYLYYIYYVSNLSPNQLLDTVGYHGDYYEARVLMNFFTKALGWNRLEAKKKVIIPKCTDSKDGIVSLLEKGQGTFHKGERSEDIELGEIDMEVLENIKGSLEKALYVLSIRGYIYSIENIDILADLVSNFGEKDVATAVRKILKKETGTSIPFQTNFLSGIDRDIKQSIKEVWSEKWKAHFFEKYQGRNFSGIILIAAINICKESPGEYPDLEKLTSGSRNGEACENSTFIKRLQQSLSCKDMKTITLLKALGISDEEERTYNDMEISKAGRRKTTSIIHN